MKTIGQYVKFRVSFVAKEFGTDRTVIDSEHAKPFEQLVRIEIPDEYVKTLESLGGIMVFKEGKYDTPENGTPGINVHGEICQTVYLPQLLWDKKAKKE